MKSRIAFMWNEDLYTSVLEEDSSMEMKTNDFNEGIELMILFKEKYGFLPYGFTMITYEEDESKNITIIKNNLYLFNGKKISSEKIEWLNKYLREKNPYYIYIDDNFCVPYHENYMTLLNINI